MMPPGEGEYDAVAAALATGKTQDEAGKAGGLSRSTVQRLMKDPAFRRRVAEFRRGAVQRALGLFTEGLADAAAYLHLTVNDGDCPAAVRVQAARLLVELALKLRSAEDLVDDVAELRADVDRLKGGITERPA